MKQNGRRQIKDKSPQPAVAMFHSPTGRNSVKNQHGPAAAHGSCSRFSHSHKKLDEEYGKDEINEDDTHHYPSDIPA